MSSMSFYHRMMGWHAPSLRRAVAVLGVFLAVAAVLLAVLPWELAVVLGWDVAALAFLGSVWHIILGADAAHIARIAAREDETPADATILLATICTASLLSVGYALGLAREHTGASRGMLISIAAVTVALSWVVLNTVFTVRYAHLYYGRSARSIDFSDDDGTPPTYRDFAYVAFTIGMTYQVSDTTLRDSRVRKTVLAHAVLAYIFGVVIVAGVVNLVAGVFRP